MKNRKHNRKALEKLSEKPNADAYIVYRKEVAK